MRGYKNQIQNYIAPALGERKIQQLTTAEIQKLYNSLGHQLCKHPRYGEDHFLSPSTIRRTHMLLHEILVAAVQAHMLPKSPTVGTTIPRQEMASRQVLNDAQLEIFKNAIAEESLWYDFFYTEITTGLRKGELCGLKWKDLNLHTGKLIVSRSVGQNSVGETKTTAGLLVSDLQ